MAKEKGEKSEEKKVEIPAHPHGFAANPTKLARAVAHVTATQPHLKHGSEEHTAAVKQHYIALNGALIGTKTTGEKRGGKVVNLADDDGSEDIDNDE